MADISNILFVLAFLATIQLTIAQDYGVTNLAADTPGGVRFDNEIGVAYTRQIITSATSFIWLTFQQTTASERKNVSGVRVLIDDIDGVAYVGDNDIHVSANYIEGYNGDVSFEITGVLYHEMTNIWQWNGDNQAPDGLIAGIADYVRLKAGYAPSHWVQPGGGDRWDQGDDVTAQFLDYCNGLRHGFVAKLNKKMIYGYNDGFFVELLGKTVDELWAEYKA